MKKIFTLLLAVGLAFGWSHSYGQDSTWLKIITKEVGLDSARGSRIMVADVNGDNYPDLIWGTGDLNKNHIGIFLNVENPDKTSPHKRIFKDFTKESNINANRDPKKTGRIVDVTALADVDNDGDVDLVTSIYYHRLQMYQGANDPGDRSEVLLNDGKGHFTIVPNSGLNTLTLVDTLPVGLINATGISFLDYDYDGKIDMYISTWFSDYAANLAIDNNGYISPDALLKGNGDGTFTLVKNSGIEKIFKPMYGVNITDWNNDGWPDIITSPYCRSGGSLFMNNKNGTFTDVAASVGYSAQLMGGDNGQALCQWEALPGDFDNDGDMDLLQVNVHGGYDAGEGRTHVTINKGPKENYKLAWDLNRLKRKAPKSTTHVSDDGGAWIDIDGDTKLDVLIGQIGYNDPSTGINMDGQTRIYFLLQDSLGNFNEITDKLGFMKTLQNGHSIEPIDFDLDGDQDILVSHLVYDTIPDADTLKPIQYYQIELLENMNPKHSNWVSLKLDPPANCNRSGIGSRIIVYSDTLKLMREIQAGIGHFANQEPFITNFGLAKRQIDSIVVRWPNKEIETTTIKNPEVNTIIEVNEQGKKGFIRTDSNAYSLISFNTPYMKIPNTYVNTSKTYPIEIKNTGNKSLNLSAVTLTGVDKSSFSLDNDLSLPATIQPGAYATVNIKFAPQVRKHYYASLKVNSDASNEQESYAEIDASGFEEKPMIAVVTDTIQFNDMWIDSSKVQHLTIRNIGEKELDFTNCKLSSDNATLTILNAAPASINPGDSTVLNIKYSPVAFDTIRTNLIITTNAYNLPSITIPVLASCNGPVATLATSTKVVQFFNVQVGDTKESSLILSNVGNADLNIKSLKLSDYGDIFIMPNNVQALTLSKDETYTLNINFVPKEGMKYTASLTLESNDSKNPTQTVKILGTGIDNGVNGVSDNNCNCDENTFNLEMTPFPAHENLNLVFRNIKYSNSDIYLKLFDVRGNLVLSTSIPNNGASNIEQKMTLPHLAKGMYYLSVTSGFEIQNYPLIIE